MTRPPRTVDDDRDAELLAAHVERGDRAALDELVTRSLPQAQALAMRLTGDRDLAEDALQEGFLRITRHAASYRGESTVRAWMLAIVANAGRDALRSRARRRLHERAASGLSHATIEDDAATPAIGAAIGALPEPYRKALVLRHVDGLAYPDIARSLHVREGTVRMRVMRGLELLRRSLVRSAQATGALVWSWTRPTLKSKDLDPMRMVLPRVWSATRLGSWLAGTTAILLSLVMLMLMLMVLSTLPPELPHPTRVAPVGRLVNDDAMALGRSAASDDAAGRVLSVASIGGGSSRLHAGPVIHASRCSLSDCLARLDAAALDGSILLVEPEPGQDRLALVDDLDRTFFTDVSAASIAMSWNEDRTCAILDIHLRERTWSCPPWQGKTRVMTCATETLRLEIETIGEDQDPGATIRASQRFSVLQDEAMVRMDGIDSLHLQRHAPALASPRADG